jgi:hypothetical protein
MVVLQAISTTVTTTVSSTISLPINSTAASDLLVVVIGGVVTLFIALLGFRIAYFDPNIGKATEEAQKRLEAVRQQIRAVIAQAVEPSEVERKAATVEEISGELAAIKSAIRDVDLLHETNRRLFKIDFAAILSPIAIGGYFLLTGNVLVTISLLLYYVIVLTLDLTGTFQFWDKYQKATHFLRKPQKKLA